MDLLASGTSFTPPPDVVASDEAPGTPIVVETGVGELPHGYLYVGFQGDARVQLTAYERNLCATPEVVDLLRDELELACGVDHPGVIRTFGCLEHDGALITVRAHPQRPSLRRFIERRISRNKPVSPATAVAIGTQLCDAIGALHPHIVHGYVSPDTVYLGKDGKVKLGATGEGRVLPYATGFDRFRAAGLLTMTAPEVLEPTPRYEPATDVYGVAAVIIEVLSGRPLPMAGAALRGLVPGPVELLDVLERAIAPDPRDRWPTVADLKAYISQFGERGRAITPVSVASTLPTAPPPPPMHGGGRGGGRAMRVESLPPPPAFSAESTERPPEFANLAMEAPPEPISEPPELLGGVPSSAPPAPPPPRKSGGKPPPPPQPGRVHKARKPEVSADDWSRLDMATKRLLDAAGPADSLTNGIGDDYRPTPSTTTRRPDGRDELSDLGLAVSEFQEAADRLETIDGESGLLGLTDLRGAPSGSQVEPGSGQLRGMQEYADKADQGFFGSLGTDEAPVEAPTDEQIMAARDRKKRSWVLTRSGVDQVARSIEQLEAMAERGALHQTDMIREDRNAPVLAVDIPELRLVFESKLDGPKRPAAEAAASADPNAPIALDFDRVTAAHRPVPKAASAPLPAPTAEPAKRASGRSGVGTLVWVLVAIAIFGAAAWVLYQRSAGS